MLTHLASLKPEILLTEMFILIPSKMQKKENSIIWEKLGWQCRRSTRSLGQHCIQVPQQQTS